MASKRRSLPRRSWDEQFALLQAFKEEHGHLRMDKRTCDGSLVRWAQFIRTKDEKAKLTTTQLEKLNALGFSWDPLGEQWNANYDRFRAFVETKGHAKVKITDNKELAVWLFRQRQLHKMGKLSEERKTKLAALGFDFESQRKNKDDHKNQSRFLEQWNIKFQKLKKYKEQHGDCMVPHDYEPDFALEKWVKRQRQQYKAGTLKQEREDKLKQIGFVLDLEAKNNQEFLDRITEVKAYQAILRQEGGDPNDMTEFLSGQTEEFRHWVVLQKRAQNEGRLDPKRKEALDEIGLFAWGGIRRPAVAKRKKTAEETLQPLFQEFCQLMDQYGNSRTGKYFKGQFQELVRDAREHCGNGDGRNKRSRSDQGQYYF